MASSYELWDSESRNLLGAYASEDEALTVVRQAIQKHGPPVVATLFLAHEDDDGRSTTIASGGDLLRRAEANERLARGKPKLPDFASIDPEKVVPEFDRVSDTLIVHLFGRGRPFTILPAKGLTMLLVDPETFEVIGLRVEGFLARAVYEMPVLLDLASFVGLGDQEVGAIRRRIASEHNIVEIVGALIAQPELASA